MSSDVYANCREITCKASDGMSICDFPDVCFTPPQTPATPMGVPIPYPNTGAASDTANGSTSVKISGQPVMLKDVSYFKKSTGDEAGCAPKKGIINSKVSGKVYFKSWSMDVKIEGENVVRHLDLTTHNHASTLGNASVPFPVLSRIAVPKNLGTKPCDPAGCPTGIHSKKKRAAFRHSARYRAAKAKVNSGPKPLVCPTCRKKKKKLSPDHTVPIAVVHRMPGFACLPKAEQDKIVNNPLNFYGMCRNCNSSKQDKLWSAWKGNKSKNISLDAGLKKRGASFSGKLEKRLEIMIRMIQC